MKTSEKLKYGFFMAWGTFSNIPCPNKIWDNRAQKQMISLVPIIGLIVGGLLALELWLIPAIGPFVPTWGLAFLMLITPVFVCGLFHMDGFMDVMDACLSRRPMEEKQRILKDSHTGAFAMIAMVFVILCFLVGLIMAIDSIDYGYTSNTTLYLAILYIPFSSRVLACHDVLRCPSIDQSQYKSMEKKKSYLILLEILLPLVLTVVEFVADPDVFNTWTCLCPLYGWFLGLVLGAIVGRWARKQLGGMNGDIAGFEIVITEALMVFFVGAFNYIGSGMYMVNNLWY
ncbi:MAG: adenosylcobinamide-GDP ribazoletransferase [Clostridia bacterium]|nr:adenosylcobinamide-GDP ribazoletransferase [Clostridia bacterium]